MTRLRAYVGRFTGFERDARVFLVAALVSGAAISLYWIDFNLYLAALGLTPATIGLDRHRRVARLGPRLVPGQPRSPTGSVDGSSWPAGSS